MELPASEVNFWQAYYNIFPFPQEREDARAAMLAAVIANISGKSLKRPLKERDFMPNYLGTQQPMIKEKSLEEQAKEFHEFKERLNAAQHKVQ